MAYVTLLWKARTIENYRLSYEREKLNSIRITNSHVTKRTLFEKISNFDTRKRLSETFSKWYPEGSSVNRFFLHFRTDQAFPNWVLKSLFGFLGGVILTYLCFMFFVYQLSISLIYATIMSSIIGVLLTLGLAFSLRMRCLVFLLIPQLFSRVGRYTLTCYALVLILTGPATNTLKNSEVLSESMACRQEEIKTSMRQINEMNETPINAVKDNLKEMTSRIRRLAEKLKDSFLKVNRLVLTLTHSIHSSFAWLDSVSRTCNMKLGTPFERCKRVLNEAAEDCRNKLGPMHSWMCNSDNVANSACWSVKHLKSFFTIDYIYGNILGAVKKKLSSFIEHLNSMLHVNLHLHHSYSYNANANRSASQVAAGIVTEIRKRADPLLTWLSWSSCVTSLFLLLIIFRAKYYQHMFETRSRFDNRFVTKELRDLDLERQRQGRETVLPLNRREKGKYIKTTSFRLVSSEKFHLSRSAVFMMITSFKLMIHMVADYSLYWVLVTIRYHGRLQTPLPPGDPLAGVYINGSGHAVKIIRSLQDAFSMPLLFQASSPASCLPDPYPPDLQRYSQIGILIILLWFAAMFEPYGLRLRHIIMGHYRPERAKARAEWLYNHIQKTRAGFMKYARRKLHREYKYSTEEKYTLRRWLNSYIPFLGGRQEDPRCLLCGAEDYTVDYPIDRNIRLVRCETPSCPGVYCTCCFSAIGQMCTICMSPIDYGDFSDASLENGSSGESSDSDHDINSNLLASSQNSDQVTKRQNLEASGNKTETNKKFLSRSKIWAHWKNITKRPEEEERLLQNSDDDEEGTRISSHADVINESIRMENKNLKDSSKKNCEICATQKENATLLFCLYCHQHYNTNNAEYTFKTEIDKAIDKRAQGDSNIAKENPFRSSNRFHTIQNSHTDSNKYFNLLNGLNGTLTSIFERLKQLRKYSLKVKYYQQNKMCKGKHAMLNLATF